MGLGFGRSDRDRWHLLLATKPYEHDNRWLFGATPRLWSQSSTSFSIRSDLTLWSSQHQQWPRHLTPTTTAIFFSHAGVCKHHGWHLHPSVAPEYRLWSRPSHTTSSKTVWPSSPWLKLLRLHKIQSDLISLLRLLHHRLHLCLRVEDVFLTSAMVAPSFFDLFLDVHHQPMATPLKPTWCCHVTSIVSLHFAYMLAHAESSHAAYVHVEPLVHVDLP